jgi:hypothetical protein
MNQRLSISLLLGVILAVSVFVVFALAGGSNGVALADDDVSPTTLTVGEITTDPQEPVRIDIDDINISPVFTDPEPLLLPHTAVLDWGDDTSSRCSSGSDPEPVSDPETCTVEKIKETGEGTVFRVTASHSYTEPGVFTIMLTVSDRDGGDGGYDEAVSSPVVVYDPEGGFVTGGGWIDSPPGACNFGACTWDTIGKASFGFVSKYKKGKSRPGGNTEFQFKAGDLNFHSDSYDWLVIADHKAMFKGTGTINGGGNYSILLSAIDAKLTPSTGVDLFRIQIKDKDNGDAVVYDNQVACSDTGDVADPCTRIGGGSIVIHKGK